MQRLSPAKVNLFLRIGPQRDDGYHTLVSWFVSTGLHDTLAFEPAVDARLILTCDLPQLAVDQSNLIIKAAELLRHATGSRQGAMIHLEKRIPMGAGLGGGSSNAATTLLALHDLWQCNLPHLTLCDLAARLGSDVPFFLNLPSAICRGRGEVISEFPSPRCRWIVLVLPLISMPTPQVYRQFDAMKKGSDLASLPPMDHLAALSSSELLSQLANDLEIPAFAIRPDLGELRAAVETHLARPVRMSGSGASLFTLFDAQADAADAAAAITTRLAIPAHAVSLGSQSVPQS